MSTYLSLFTGAGGLDLGLDTAGWTCTGQAEIDATCRAVLARHWPNVPKWDDVRDVGFGDRRESGRPRLPVGDDADAQGPETPNLRGVDLIAGGFPCQDISVAGRRAGLAGDRSGLWWEFHRIVESVRPRAVLVENVEGLLSSNGGRDMGAIIDALADLGYGVAWRVLDAQHFGVPQRRRRVFLLAITGGRTGAERAAEVLALTPGSSRDPQEGPSPRPRVAATLTSGSHRPGVNPPGRRKEDAYNLVVGTLTRGGHGKLDDQAIGAGQLIANALDRQAGGPDDNSAQANHLIPVAFHQTQDPITKRDGTPALGAKSMGMGMGIHYRGVRRLTPRECERLMGWPDDHTRWTADGTEIADSRRYAMCGNGVAAPVAAWIGARLLAELTQPVEAAA